MKIRFANNSKGRPMRPIEAVIFGLVFTLCGVALLFYSFQTIKDYKEKDAKYIEVSAEVVDYRENSEGLLAIIAEYEVDGEKYTKTGSTYSNSPKSIGSKVSVKYNPINPKDSIWKNDSTNLVLPLVSTGFTLVGLLIFVIGIIGFKGKNKKEIDNNDDVNKAISDFETTQTENNVIDNTIGAVATPVMAALNGNENVSVEKENVENKVEENVQVASTTTEDVTTNEVPVEAVPVVEPTPTVEPVVENVVSTVNPVVEQNNNESTVLETEPLKEEVVQVESPVNENVMAETATLNNVQVNEPVTENVVPTVLQNVVSGNDNNEIQAKKPVEVAPSVEPIKEETVKPVTVNEPVVENVVPTVEQNVQQSVNNNI